MFKERKFDIVEWLSREDNLVSGIKRIGNFIYSAVTREKLELPCGASISIQRSPYHYCDIRDYGMFEQESYRDIKYMIFESQKNKPIEEVEVELGFPNFVDERLLELAEDSENPTDTIYAFVPAKLIEEIINEKLDKYYGEERK